MYSFLFLLILFSVLTPLFGFGLGSKKVLMYSTRFMFLSTFFSFFAFYEVILLGSNCEIYFIDWFNILNFNIKLGLYFDRLSTTMFCLVIFISSLVHLYSQNYMAEDPHKVRFFFYLSLFTFFMCLMVLSPNLVQFFFAWEGVGLASYLLINFWFTRYEANRSAMKAMMMNRFGDFGLYFALLLCFAFYKTTDISVLNAIFHETYYHNTFIYLLGYRINLQELVCFFLFLAVVGKSAQLGLHTWLPDAMEGPTPVSALLHAATMVTAGVYLLLRLSYLFSSAPVIMGLITVWGALTAFYAATIGAFQFDIKKIIAYSTCSQLGYMVSTCGLYNFSGSFFHLFNHAFFKALLFLGAGAIIHSLANEQDLRKYGALFQTFPLLFVCMLIGSLSLVGFPFLSGFYSKDHIINWSYSNHENYSNFSYWLLLLAAFFTAYYSTKLLNLTFFSNPKYPKIRHNTATESDHKVLLPIWILTLLSIFSGYLFYDVFVGYGTSMMGLNVNPAFNYSIDLEYVGTFRKNIAFLFVILGVSSYFYFHYIFLYNFNTLLRRYNLLVVLVYIKNFFNKKWFFDYFYSQSSLFVLKLFYNVLFKTFERGFLEDIFIKKPIYVLNETAKFVVYSQNSSLNNYIILIVNILFLFFFVFTLFFFNLNHKLIFFICAFFFYKVWNIWKK